MLSQWSLTWETPTTAQSALSGGRLHDNPDLPVGFLIDILVGIEEDRAGLGAEYRFG